MPVPPGLAAAAALFVDAFVVLGVVAPYVLQLRATLSERRAAGSRGGGPAGFSPYASLILITSSTLRILYFLGHPFGLPLLFQAIASIATQFCVLWVTCGGDGDAHPPQIPAGARLAVTRSPQPTSPRSPHSGLRHAVPALDAASFWRWPDFESYALVFAVFVLALLLLAGILHPAPAWAVELVGASALLVEALLPVPQCLTNLARRSTAGLSPSLVVAWAGGDVFKTIYALVRREPLYFVGCGAFQLAVDVVILLQMQGVWLGLGPYTETRAKEDAVGAAALATERTRR